MGSCPAVQRVRRLRGQPLHCSSTDAGLSPHNVPTREAMVMSPPATAGFSSIALLPWCLAFFHRHFPPRSPPSHPLDPSLHSQQLPSPWDCSMIPKLQLPAAAPSRGTASLFRVCMAAARTVGFSFI